MNTHAEVELPKAVEEAMIINGNTYLQNAIAKEMKNVKVIYLMARRPPMIFSMIIATWYSM